MEVSASGYFTRGAQILYATTRSDLTISLIPSGAPFSLTFYRQLARGAFDGGGPRSLLRWTAIPKFYIRTVDNTTGRAVEPEVLTVVQDWLRRGLLAWTNNQWSVGTLEIGAEQRPDAAGWITVEFIRTRELFCGQARIGGNPGHIILNNDPGPPWPAFAKAMGLEGSGGNTANSVYVVSVFQAAPGHRDQLEKALAPDPAAKVPVGNAMLQHLEGGTWNYLTLQRFNSWQDYATNQSTTSASAGSGSGQGNWSEVREHIAVHHDTIADRIAPK